MTLITEMIETSHGDVKDGYHLMLQADGDWVAWQTIRDGLKIPMEFVTSRPMADAEIGRVVRAAFAATEKE